MGASDVKRVFESELESFFCEYFQQNFYTCHLRNLRTQKSKATKSLTTASLQADIDDFKANKQQKCERFVSEKVTFYMNKHCADHGNEEEEPKAFSSLHPILTIRHSARGLFEESKKAIYDNDDQPMRALGCTPSSYRHSTINKNQGNRVLHTPLSSSRHSIRSASRHSIHSARGGGPHPRLNLFDDFDASSDGHYSTGYRGDAVPTSPYIVPDSPMTVSSQPDFSTWSPEKVLAYQQNQLALQQEDTKRSELRVLEGSVAMGEKMQKQTGS